LPHPAQTQIAAASKPTIRRNIITAPPRSRSPRSFWLGRLRLRINIRDRTDNYRSEHPWEYTPSRKHSVSTNVGCDATDRTLAAPPCRSGTDAIKPRSRYT
jgi:hypothetical protein